MKVLFVSSGNLGKINPLILAQAESLTKKGIIVDFELIIGKGIFGYLKNIPKLVKKIRQGNYDLVHAHFSLSAYVATLAMPKQLIVSLMGSDVFQSIVRRWITWFFASYIWDETIVKSEEMFKMLKVKKAKIIPNGVSLGKFKPKKKSLAQNELGWDQSIKHILFAANPARKVKNFTLGNEAFKLIQDGGYQLHTLVNVPHEEIPNYYNAADLIILSSFWEGSPNVIKEALACNRPIVSTDCGDVKELFRNVDGCFIAKYDPLDFSEKMKKGLSVTQTNGRISVLNLDDKIIAEKLSEIYFSKMNKIKYNEI